MATSSESNEDNLATQTERLSVNGKSHRLEVTENGYELLDKGWNEMQSGWSDETLQKLTEKASECIHLSEYMKLLPEDSLPEEEIDEFLSLLKLKSELHKKVHLLSEENSQLVMKLDKRKRQLKEIMRKRGLVLNKALKLYEAANFQENNTKSEDNNQSIDSNESVSGKSDESINLRCLHKLRELCTKYYKIQEIAHVLFQLVCGSRVDYVLEEDLFKVYLCCGKISNTMFNEHNLKKVNEVMDEILVKLADVKIEKIAAQPEEPRTPLTFEDILNEALSTNTNDMISKMLK